MTCAHVGSLPAEVTPSTTDGCSDCLANGRDDWVHLRMCLSCGHVGCCDSSPARHATAHFNETQHPIMQSREPGEDWRWCFADQTAV